MKLSIVSLQVEEKIRTRVFLVAFCDKDSHMVGRTHMCKDVTTFSLGNEN